MNSYRPNCPYCGTKCNPAEYVDIGVGQQAVTPHQCHNCGAVEIGAFVSAQTLTDKEKETGWYAPTIAGA